MAEREEVQIVATFVDNVSKNVKGMGDVFSEITTGALRHIGTIAVDAFGMAASAAFDFGSTSVDMASSLNESVSKVGVVFGDSAGIVENFASTAAAALGQSEQQALEAAGTYGNLLTSIGILPDAAADMSTSLVTLASDLASFNNVSPEETLLALRSALTGEFEPMKRFGAALSADAVAAYALENGLAATKDELTPAIKAQAAYALILQQTTNAQGDFARTSDGLANQQRIAAAQWADLQTAVGSAFLPLMIELTSVFNSELMPVLSELATDTLPQLIPVITQIGLAAVQFISETLIPAFMAAVTWIQANWPAIQAAIMDGWAQAQPVLQAIGDFISTIVIPAFQSVVAWVQANWPAIQAAIMDGWAQAQPILQAIGDFISTVVIPAFQTAVTWVQTNWPAIQATISAVMLQIQTVISGVLTGIQTFWATWGDEISALAKRAFDNVQLFFSVFTAAFEGDWHRVGEILREIWDGLWASIQEITNNAIAWFGQQDWGQIGSDIVSGIANGISAGAQWVMDAMLAVAQAAWDVITGFFDAHSDSRLMIGLGKDMMSGLAHGIDNNATVPTTSMAGAAYATAGAAAGAVNNYYNLTIHSGGTTNTGAEFGRMRAVAGAF